MSLQKVNPTTHVIFDFGGTIADLSLLFEKLLQEFIVDLDKNSLKYKSLIEKVRETESFNQIIRDMIEKFDFKIEGCQSPTIDEIKQNILKFVGKNQFPFKSGAEKLIHHLYENDIPMAIATNLDKTIYELVLKSFEGFDPKYFSHWVCGADDPQVKANKPAPDVYLVCAERFNSPPKSLRECVIFEDSIRGITGALNTGMKTVLINDCNDTELKDIANKITAITDSLANFKPESVGLPPYPKGKKD